MTDNRNGGRALPGDNGNVTILPQVPWEDYSYAKIKMRLDLYDDMIVATRYEREGSPYSQGGQHVRQAASYVVDPLDLAARLGDLDINSGLLPPGCLFWQRRAGSERLGLFVPPQVRALSVVPTDRPNRTIPLPGLILIGQGTDYSLFAVKESGRPGLKPESQLYNAPLPNVAGDKGICAGQVRLPVAGPGTVAGALALILESGFNNHLIQQKSRKYPNNILRMWRILHRAKAEQYPLDDLVDTGVTLGEVIRRGT